MILLDFSGKHSAFSKSNIIAGVSLLNNRDKLSSLKEIADFLGFSDFFYASQIHSGKTIVFEDSTKGEEGDAVLCFEKDVLIGVFTADCVPVYLFSDKFCGIIHAGWRGFVNGIFESFFSKLKEKKVFSNDIKAIIGAAICGDCYEVGIEVAELFPSDFVKNKNKKNFLDLKACALEKLLSIGLSRENIVLTPYCTYHNKWFNSFRRDKTECRNINYIGIKS